MTLNDTWGFKSYDENWKSTETLVRNLIDIASKGGNYLLNVGPTPQGEIPAASVERLAGMGKWMAVNGESIYGTSASPFSEQLPFGRATKKGESPLRAGVRLAGQRHADAAVVGRHAGKGMAGRDESRRAAEDSGGRRHAHATVDGAGSDCDGDCD